MPNDKVLNEKTELVSLTVNRLRESSCTVVTDYRGLNVLKLLNFVRELREAGIEFQVLKNSLTRRATAEADLTDLDTHLTGPTAIAFRKVML